ncbi:3-phosphoserine/phosphohydroxythreonine transaminase [Silanimonas sp.]|uniref:3-phosphoserine/phosphohydroxythreonine transaminase n=1 Tax=Silanimonas sp. TaxID=1929290 RepID=UPI0037CC03B8
MSRGFNFSAGPAVLPEPVLRRAQAELLEWGGERASVMEVSHRGKAFIAVAEKAEADLRKLMGITDDYAVLFLQGGATTHFALLPMNLAAAGQRADYLVTGAWSKKAASEAKPHAAVSVVADTAASTYTTLPTAGSYALDPSAAYVHLVANETIHGVEFPDAIDTGGVPLVADFSSSILSRPIDVSKYGVIYAGAQKNIGPSGLVVMVIRKDLLERAGQSRAKILSYKEHAAQGSMLNTPPTFSWYLAGLVFEWMLEQGGLGAFEANNRRKAEALYSAIDGSGGFYRNPVALDARSLMNVPFMLKDAALDAAFLKESEAAGLLALKGHRDLGGMRASIYNALPYEAVAALVDFMGDFAKRHG